MARVLSAVTTVRRVSPTDGQTLTQTAADATNLNYFPMTGNEVLIAWNSGASSRTVTITSVADKNGRTGDITADSIAADEIKIYPFFKTEGWSQGANGQLYHEANHADVKFMVVKFSA